MKKLRVFQSISVNGYFIDANGEMNWEHAGHEDAEFAAWVSKNASFGGEFPFGRKTYQMMEAFRPTPMAAKQMLEVVRGMNAARKYVASRTIQPTWNNTYLLNGDLVTAVRNLKASATSDITLLCSGNVAAQFGDAGLVDGYQFVIVPIALGGGRTVFAKKCKLRLLDPRVLRCGNVVVTYEA